MCSVSIPAKFYKFADYELMGVKLFGLKRVVLNALEQSHTYYPGNSYPKISVYNIYQDFKVFSTIKDKIIKKQKDVTVKQDSLFVSPSPTPLKK